MKMIKLIVMDVDGTLTDGGIYYSESGSEIKNFNSKDAAGILACQAIGIDCMILTGRTGKAVERRAEDLHIKYVYQGITDKMAFLLDFLKEHKMDLQDVFYIGDDLNDIKCMNIAGVAGCPADASPEILLRADYIASHNGGHGAVRDVLFSYLKDNNLYDDAISKAYDVIF